MPAITEVEIDGFRCFEKLRVRDLTPVSVFVGTNNSGKTALLEAIEAVTSDGNLLALCRASYERGEFRWRQDARPAIAALREPSVEIDVRHWFFGHELRGGSTFTLRGRGKRVLTFTRSLHHDPDNTLLPVGAWQLLSDGDPAAPLVYLTADGFLPVGPPGAFASFATDDSESPVGFVTTDRLFPRELGRLWNTIELTPKEIDVLSAMRLVDPTIERIAISGANGSANARVLRRGAAAPLPLGTLGEGVSRILTLALYLVCAQNGYLLIDEIENGLHWSTMPKVWRFLVETAQKLDVQVFATTHSRDCLDGIAALHRDSPALASRVSVHRLEAGREEPVRFDAARIAEYVEMELEAR
jgi:hypothetical protein